MGKEVDMLTMTPEWGKSSHCTADANCVELVSADPHILVRDSKLWQSAGALAIPISDMRRFASAIKAGQYDRPIAA